MGFDGYLEMEGDEEGTAAFDSRLFANMISDVTYYSGEGITAILAKKYGLDLAPLSNLGDESDGTGWQDPAELAGFLRDFLAAVESEGEALIGMTMDGYFIYPTDARMIKDMLTELIVHCEAAARVGKRVRIMIC
jgi:hypothetical protein